MIAIVLLSVLVTYELALRVCGYRSRFRIVRDDAGHHMVEYTVRRGPQ